MRSLCSFIARCFSGGHNLLKSYSKGRVSMTTFCLYCIQIHSCPDLPCWLPELFLSEIVQKSIKEIAKVSSGNWILLLAFVPTKPNDQAGLHHSLLLIRKVSRKLWGFQFDGVIILIFVFLPFDSLQDKAGIWSLKGGIINFFARPFH